MGKYYYLIAGLPELQLDDQKLKLSLTDFKTELEENLSESDKQLVGYFFMQFDNVNLLKLLTNPDSELDARGNLSAEGLREIILLFKETDEPADKLVYEYFKKFVPAYLKEEPLYLGMSWDDQITSLYYDYAISCKNEFVSEWFEFNLNIKNILLALNCRKYGLNSYEYIIGTSEISESIRNSNSRDFGIVPVFSEVEEIIRIAEESDIYERERKLDLMRWNWLEEKGFFHYFDIEHLFVYLVKLEMLERWVRLEKETGLAVFREMIEKLRHSFEFPNEFTIRKVK